MADEGWGRPPLYPPLPITEDEERVDEEDESKLARAGLRRALVLMSPEVARVMKLRYGWHNRRPKDVAAVATATDMSVDQVEAAIESGWAMIHAHQIIHSWGRPRA